MTELSPVGFPDPEQLVMANQLIDKQQTKTAVIDVTIRSDSNIRKKDPKKLEKYQGLKEELEKMQGSTSNSGASGDGSTGREGVIIIYTYCRYIYYLTTLISFVNLFEQMKRHRKEDKDCASKILDPKEIIDIKRGKSNNIQNK